MSDDKLGKGIVESIKEGGNVYVYDSSKPLDFTWMFDKPVKRKPFMMHISLDQSEYMSATFSGDTKKLREIEAKWAKRSAEAQERNYAAFISTYGIQIYNQIAKLEALRGKFENILSAKSEPFYFSWDISDEDDNQDYTQIQFWKGQFNIVRSYCAGYGGSKIIKENISHSASLGAVAKYNKTKNK